MSLSQSADAHWQRLRDLQNREKRRREREAKEKREREQKLEKKLREMSEEDPL